jgi:hypothetical protein
MKKALEIITTGLIRAEGRLFGFEPEPPSPEAIEILQAMVVGVEPDDD